MKHDERVAVWVPPKLRDVLKIKAIKLGYTSVYDMLQTNLPNLTIKK